MSQLSDSGDDSGGAGRGLQRQSTAELSFFTPSSLSFNPKPYFPHPTHAPSRTKSFSSSSLQRESSSSMLAQKSLDVAHNDPDATFIRYPFTSFPDAHLYHEGLTYDVLAKNPHWFLDPTDFRKENDTDPNRIAYPQALEPPRGWCPTKKRDVRMKGAEAYGGEDAPKLRCTFCRRSYAGVNAKSMWRRHVLEKHKIPMSNRRDGFFEGGGRGRSSSNKENKRSMSSGPVPASNDLTVDDFFKSKPKDKETLVEPLPLPKGISENRSARNLNTKSRTVRLDEEAIASSEQLVECVDATSKTSQPQLVPDDDAKNRSSHRSPEATEQMLPPSSPLDEGTSHMSWRDLLSLPPSPMRTPGNAYNKRSRFKMPWKFPSPSHPLHSGPDELCLGVPIGGMTGEGLRSSYVALQASPFPGTVDNQSQFSSPIAASPLNQKPVTGRVLGWKRSKGKPKSKLPPLPEPSPRRPLYTGPLPVPISDSFELTPTPDLTMSTDSDADHSFSTLGEPFPTNAFSNWFEMSSPAKSKKDHMTLGFPDTPLRRSTSSSAFEHLQLVSGENEDVPSSNLLPSGFGLGFNFKFDLKTSGAKRARSEDRTEHDSDDEFGELLYPSADEEPSSSRKKNLKGTSKHNSANSSLSSVPDQSAERESVPPTDLDSEDLDSIFGESAPAKKRRLFV